jgi:hypothetical protein
MIEASHPGSLAAITTPMELKGHCDRYCKKARIGRSAALLN